MARFVTLIPAPVLWKADNVHLQTSAATVAVTYFILTLLIGIVLFAYPKTRTVHHDAFERVHRFLGWTATALVWVQVSAGRIKTPHSILTINLKGCPVDQRLQGSRTILGSRSSSLSSPLAR